jgi:cytochrome d ubiquinol oxidase subunit I
MLSMAMWMLLIVAPIQAVIGDFMHGLNTLQHQPAKIAAIEGHWAKRSPAKRCRCCCSAYRTWKTKDRFAVGIPHLGSLILTHSWGRPDQGPEGIPARGPAEFPDRVLEFPR